MNIVISDSVGKGGRNKPEDVLIIQRRLSELGFQFFAAINGRYSTGLANAIHLFQSIIKGRNTVRGDGRVDVDQETIQFLRASNAPRWQLMPLRGEGFFNRERQDDTDHHDYGTDWMANTIINVGKAYQADYHRAHPNAALVAINDVSLPEGGDTEDHAGHETGLACDLYLPRKNGEVGQVTWRDFQYDRDVMRAMLKAIRKQPLIRVVLFNDEELIEEGLCSKDAGHDNHVHFDISPPRRRMDDEPRA